MLPALPDGVQLVCVSKYQPISAIQQLYDAGCRLFGESRAQELAEKADCLPRDISWHFIGHLQTNKVRQVVAVASCIQSVDSERLLRAIDREAARIDKEQHVLLEVHVAREYSKSGLTPDELRRLLVEVIPGLHHVYVDGLMGMATNTDDEQEIHRCFGLLHDLLTESRSLCPSMGSELSMGMSDDYPLALQHGATMVRLGSAIFGQRNYQPRPDKWAVFFDMDGVLFDSMGNHAVAWSRVMTEHGLPFTHEDTYRNEGRTGQAVIAEAMLKYQHRQATDDEVRDIYAEKAALFHSLGETQPVEGVIDVLHFLQSQGVEIWIVTGSGQLTLFDRLQHVFPGIFTRSHMITAYDVVHGKPDPEPYRKAWQRSGTLIDHCFVVENAPLGVRAGAAAGIRTLAVNTGPLPDHDLACEGAEKVFANMHDLLAWMTLQKWSK